MNTPPSAPCNISPIIPFAALSLSSPIPCPLFMYITRSVRHIPQAQPESTQEMLQAWSTLSSRISLPTADSLIEILTTNKTQALACLTQLFQFITNHCPETQQKIIDLCRDYLLASWTPEQQVCLKPERVYLLLQTLASIEDSSLRNQTALEIGRISLLFQDTFAEKLPAFLQDPQQKHLQTAHAYRIASQTHLVIKDQSICYQIQYGIEQALQQTDPFAYIPSLNKEYFYLKDVWSAESFTQTDLKQIRIFLQEKRPMYQDQARKEQRTLYLPTHQTGLPRSLHVTPTGQVCIHLTRKKAKKDRLLGKGAFKTVTEAIDIDTQKRYASASMTRQSLYRQEIWAHQQVLGLPGFIQLYAYMQYDNKKSIRKYRLLFPQATGTLEAYMPTLTLQEKGNLSQQLIKAIASLHAKGILHRDLKPANLLIQQTEEGNIELLIADLGNCCKLENTAQCSIEACTPRYSSPEYKRAVQSEHPTEICHATTKALDAYSIGLILQQLFGKKQALFPSIYAVITRMLSINPTERILPQAILPILPLIEFPQEKTQAPQPTPY